VQPQSSLGLCRDQKRPSIRPRPERRVGPAHDSVAPLSLTPSWGRCFGRSDRILGPRHASRLPPPSMGVASAWSSMVESQLQALRRATRGNGMANFGPRSPIRDRHRSSWVRWHTTLNGSASCCLGARMSIGCRFAIRGSGMVTLGLRSLILGLQDVAAMR